MTVYDIISVRLAFIQREDLSRCISLYDAFRVDALSATRLAITLCCAPSQTVVDLHDNSSSNLKIAFISLHLREISTSCSIRFQS